VRSWARWVRSTASWVASGRSGRGGALTVDMVWSALLKKLSDQLEHALERERD